MKCCLCPNEEDLLVNVVNDHGLILIFCKYCEDTPALEAAARLAVENERLRKALESISENSLNCFNCSASMLAEKALEAKK